MEKKLKTRKNRRKKPPSEAKEPQGEAPQWHKNLKYKEGFVRRIAYPPEYLD
jgi:hypothetical protein